MSDSRAIELSEFLRSRRAQLTPEQVGLPSGNRRRTPGLRREEVAQLAGVGLTWYTRLEQGRDIRVSTDVLESLSRALQLSRNDRETLFILAHLQPPPCSVDFVTTMLNPDVQMLIDNLPASPAYVLGPFGQLIAWNDAAADLLCLEESSSEREKNMLWRLYHDSAWQQLFPDWELAAKSVLAHTSSSCIRFLQSAPAYLEGLPLTVHESFVPPRELNLMHPVEGAVTFAKTVLQVEGVPEHKLFILSIIQASS